MHLEGKKKRDVERGNKEEITGRPKITSLLLPNKVGQKKKEEKTSFISTCTTPRHRWSENRIQRFVKRTSECQTFHLVFTKRTWRKMPQAFSTFLLYFFQVSTFFSYFLGQKWHCFERKQRNRKQTVSSEWVCKMRGTKRNNVRVFSFQTLRREWRKIEVQVSTLLLSRFIGKSQAKELRDGRYNSGVLKQCQ